MSSISIYKLKSGKELYKVQVYAGINPANGNKKMITKRGFHSRKAASNYAKELEAKLSNDSKRFDSLRPSMKISDYLEEWINELKINVKEGSMIIYRYNVSHYLIPQIGYYTLGNYGLAEHQKFINYMLTHYGRKGTGLAYSTVNIINATLSNALKKAVQLGYINRNPTVGVEFNRQLIEEQRPKLHYWTRDQANRFLEAALQDREAVWFPFFLTILDIGARKGEAMAFQWQDINLIDGTYDINKTRLYRKETGDLADKIVLDDPKFEASKRKGVLTTRLQDALKQLFLLSYPEKEIIAINKYSTSNNEDFVFKYFTRKSRGQVLRNRSTNGAFNRIKNKVNLPDITIHDLRHTHAVFLRESGVSLDDIRDILGHKDISTTQIYAEITPKVKERASKKYEDYINQVK